MVPIFIMGIELEVAVQKELQGVPSLVMTTR